MSEKFIPSSDAKFRIKAEVFARGIARDPERYAVSREDADALTQAVECFSQKQQKAHCRGNRSQRATREKNEARAVAERSMRKLANEIRVNESVDAHAKFCLGIPMRPQRSRARNVPQEPPRLTFVRARHEANKAAPQHVLRFRALDHSCSKPAGAVRLELFVDLVPPEEPVPAHPGANLNSRPWYLRSFTRSPIVLVPPMTTVPMRVVYWGRWADAKGNVGPFSRTVVAWVEGGSHHIALPNLGGGERPTVVPPLELPGSVESGRRSVECRMMLLEAQQRSYDAHVVPMLEGAGEDDVQEHERKLLDAA